MSPKKKNKIKNSFQVPAAGKHKGKGVKGLSFFTSSQRKDFKLVLNLN